VDRFRPELRRAGPTELGDVGEDRALLGRIRDEIRASGPMPFARFMELALYDPDGGYYRSASARPGRGGDFITAPELHPIFGETLAAAVVAIWRDLAEPGRFVIREHGAGDGALAVPLLDAAVAMEPRLGPALRYQPVDVDPRRIETVQARLATAGLASHVDGDLDRSTGFDGVVIANEVLDALPVHRVRDREGRLREIAVDLGPDDAFVEVEIDPSTAALAQRLMADGVELVDGQTAEICLALDDWVAAAAAPLRRGVLLLIDYGFPAAELYDPVRRRDGTLRAYLRHQVNDDPYRHVGRQDLTAHVDVTAVERAAHAAGLTTLGITTQAEALVGLGIEARLQAIQADPATTVETYTLVRSALMRLLDPAAMGRFRVMAYGRDWPASAPRLDLFAFRLPERGRARAARD
jgi:SAM-dependent MidA family methyltransferase